jgi:hypothetical protein
MAIEMPEQRFFAKAATEAASMNLCPAFPYPYSRTFLNLSK